MDRDTGRFIRAVGVLPLRRDRDHWRHPELFFVSRYLHGKRSCFERARVCVSPLRP